MQRESPKLQKNTQVHLQNALLVQNLLENQFLQEVHQAKQHLHQAEPHGLYLFQKPKQMPTDNHLVNTKQKLKLLSRVFQDQQEKMKKISMHALYITSQLMLKDHGGNLMTQLKEFTVIMQLILILHMTLMQLMPQKTSREQVDAKIHKHLNYPQLIHITPDLDSQRKEKFWLNFPLEIQFNNQKNVIQMS